MAEGLDETTTAQGSGGDAVIEAVVNAVWATFIHPLQKVELGLRQRLPLSHSSGLARFGGASQPPGRPPIGTALATFRL